MLAHEAIHTEHIAIVDHCHSRLVGGFDLAGQATESFHRDLGKNRALRGCYTRSPYFR